MDAKVKAQVVAMEKFADDLVTQRFAGQEVTPEEKEELKKEALERLGTFVIEATLDEFTDEDAIVFGKMIDEKRQPEEIDAFTREKIPDYENFTNGLFEKFKGIYLEI